jgi:uncharacterized protein (TIRG00374 family)
MTFLGADRWPQVLVPAALGTLVGVVLLWLVFRGSDTGALVGVLRTSDPVLVLYALCAGLAAVVTKACRWVVLLQGTVAMRLSTSLEAVFVGSAGNALISHLGEVPRIVMASRATGASSAGLLATIIAERVFDLVALATLLALLLVVADEGHETSVRLEWVLGGAGLVALVVALVVMRVGAWISARLDQGSDAAPQGWRIAVASRLRQVVQALEVFRNRSQLMLTFALSIVMWALYAVCILASLRATGGPASFGDALLVLGINAVALILPAPPGRIGTIEASFAFALAGTALGEARILAASIIYNALMTVPLWIIGGVVWWRHARRSHA